MNPRDYWSLYIERNGGPTQVSKRLGIPFSTIAGVTNGSRGIGESLALRMAAADPLLDKNILIWVRAQKQTA